VLIIESEALGMGCRIFEMREPLPPFRRDFDRTDSTFLGSGSGKDDDSPAPLYGTECRWGLCVRISLCRSRAWGRLPENDTVASKCNPALCTRAAFSRRLSFQKTWLSSESRMVSRLLVYADLPNSFFPFFFFLGSATLLVPKLVGAGSPLGCPSLG
jgi:hypothetical protein